jgi:hypothetical protein
MQDQATSPIVIEDEDVMIITLPIYKLIRQLKPMLSKEMIALESRNRSSQQSSRGSSSRNTRSQDKFQELLRELSTPVRGETVEANVEEETGEDSVSKSLARLYQKAIKTGLRATKANQEEITCWYNLC